MLYCAGMFTPARALELDANQRKRLQSLADSGKTPQKVALRVHIVLLASQGRPNHAIAQELKTSRPTVLLWRGRFAQKGVSGLLQDAPRSGRKKALTADQIQAVVEATLQTTPAGATHWTTRTLAKAHELSHMTVQRIWKQHRLQPHRLETFKLSRDPQFVAKLRDVVGLYLNPPDKALVLSVDEKSQIQALDRTAPLLPLRPGIPARQTHDYKRYGTTTLFAALSLLDGKVIGRCLRWTPSFRPLSAENKMDSRGLLSWLLLFVCRSLCASNPFGKERASRAWHCPSSLSVLIGFQYLPPQAV